MSWLAERTARYAEDMAYCTLGILNITLINTPYNIDEKAFLLLQEELARRSSDESLFIWQDPGGKASKVKINGYSKEFEPIESSGLLAPWPICSRDCQNITVHSRMKERSRVNHRVENDGIMFPFSDVLPHIQNAADWMAVNRRMRRSFNLALNCWKTDAEGHRGKFSKLDTITIKLKKKEGGHWWRVGAQELHVKWMGRNSENMLAPKSVQTNIPHRTQSEGRNLSRELNQLVSGLLEARLEAQGRPIAKGNA